MWLIWNAKMSVGESNLVEIKQVIGLIYSKNSLINNCQINYHITPQTYNYMCFLYIPILQNKFMKEFYEFTTYYKNITKNI